METESGILDKRGHSLLCHSLPGSLVSPPVGLVSLLGERKHVCKSGVPRYDSKMGKILSTRPKQPFNPPSSRSQLLNHSALDWDSKERIWGHWAPPW